MQEEITRLLQRLHLPYYTWNLIIIAAAIVIGLLIKGLLSLFAHFKAKQSKEYSFLRSAIQNLGTPFNFFIPLIVLNFLIPIMRMNPALLNRLAKGVEIALIIFFAWILVRAINVLQSYIQYKYQFSKSADNLRERKIRTQLLYIRQVVVGLIIFLAVTAVLLSFSSMRKIGAGLLTSVGVGGIIVGFAAQKSIANLLAGFQIAFTQPLRIDDVLIVEGEFGRVEEITLTYVVMHLWDHRRLILPINYFLEKPFQNWTRTSAEILGTVFLYTDYTVPVEALRQELTRLLKENSLWDGQVNALQVTDTTERTVQIRALMSARNSGQAFDLRCYVRENLINFIKENYPEALPKTRAEVVELETMKQV